MTSYVRNEKGHKRIKFDAKAIKAAYAKLKSSKKRPTSVCLPEDIISKLKKHALEMEIPYQVLMRKLIIDGLTRL